MGRFVFDQDLPNLLQRVDGELLRDTLAPLLVASKQAYQAARALLITDNCPEIGGDVERPGLCRGALGTVDLVERPADRRMKRDRKPAGRVLIEPYEARVLELAQGVLHAAEERDWRPNAHAIDREGHEHDLVNAQSLKSLLESGSEFLHGSEALAGAIQGESRHDEIRLCRPPKVGAAGSGTEPLKILALLRLGEERDIDPLDGQDTMAMSHLDERLAALVRPTGEQRDVRGPMRLPVDFPPKLRPTLIGRIEVIGDDERSSAPDLLDGPGEILGKMLQVDDGEIKIADHLPQALQQQGALADARAAGDPHDRDLSAAIPA